MTTEVKVKLMAYITGSNQEMAEKIVSDALSDAGIQFQIFSSEVSTI